MPVPAAGGVGDALKQVVWMEDDAISAWSPPACTGWRAGPTKVLLAAAGRFAMAGDSEALVSRLARVSGLTDLVYWSTTRDKWRKLFKQAVALAGPDRATRRDDFSADEFVTDATLYYWLKEDNPTAGVVYQMRIHERTPSRLVFESVNVTPVKASALLLGIRIAAPGEFRQLYYLERESGSTWHYYSLVRMGQASGLAGTSEANYRNRAAAYFRYLAELDMDREPPAAR
jgi:dipeptidyl aminopeptidase/acylaminoacyl peptidase